MAEVTHPPLDGKSGKPVLLALVPRDPLLPGPMGVAAAQPGEAGVKHHRFTELRGLQVCWWPVPSLTQALVHPAISRLNCAPYQDSIREAQAAAHSCQAGGPLGGGGKSSPPVPVLEDSSVCCSMRQPPPVPSRGAGTQWALGLGSLRLKPTSTTPRSWTSGVILKPSDP